MRNSTVLAKIRAGGAAKIAQMGHVLPPFIAYAAYAGYEGIWLDMEHFPMDNREVQTLLAFCHLYDIDALVRVPTREKTQLYRYLEDGAAGLIIPHVSTPEEARDLVQKVKFPPVGDRGLSPPNLQANFGLDLPDSRQPLVDHALRETSLILQIETPLGVSNVGAIASVPGVDGLFVGPSDLALRMQHETEDQRLAYKDSLTKVETASAAAGIFWGTMPREVNHIRTQVKMGAKMLVWGTDTTLLRAGLTQCARDLDAVLTEA